MKTTTTTPNHQTTNRNTSRPQKLKETGPRIRPLGDLLNDDTIKPRQQLCGPWLLERGFAMVFAPTGVGKSYLACALGHKACRDGYSVVYRRASRLFDELAQARADGTYPHVLRRLAKAQVLILDDFGLEPLAEYLKRAFGIDYAPPKKN